ncbi:type II toxin-antitoxin system VapC family toxin [Candidatus Binatia bacterium]|nr:type II toxin-antitoxin system VapC family toxin [Candidatus Binatia bacterium]
MIAVDTNILVRHLTQDDAAQSAKVQHLIDDIERREDAVFVSHIVLCEMCWVLSAVYGFRKREIVAAIGALLGDAIFALEERPSVETALGRYEESGGQFPDHLIGIVGSRVGADTTYTLDRRAATLPGFTLLR